MIYASLGLFRSFVTCFFFLKIMSCCEIHQFVCVFNFDSFLWIVVWSVVHYILLGTVYTSSEGLMCKIFSEGCTSV